MYIYSIQINQINNTSVWNNACLSACVRIIVDACVSHVMRAAVESYGAENWEIARGTNKQSTLIRVRRANRKCTLSAQMLGKHHTIYQARAADDNEPRRLPTRSRLSPFNHNNNNDNVVKTTRCLVYSCLAPSRRMAKCKAWWVDWVIDRMRYIHKKVRVEDKYVLIINTRNQIITW